MLIILSQFSFSESVPHNHLLKAVGVHSAARSARTNVEITTSQIKMQISVPKVGAMFYNGNNDYRRIVSRELR